MRTTSKNCIHDLFHTPILYGLDILEVSRTTILEMVEPSCDDTNKVLSVIPEERFACLDRSIMADWGWGIHGVTYTSHNRAD